MNRDSTLVARFIVYGVAILFCCATVLTFLMTASAGVVGRALMVTPLAAGLVLAVSQALHAYRTGPVRLGPEGVIWGAPSESLRWAQIDHVSARNLLVVLHSGSRQVVLFIGSVWEVAAFRAAWERGRGTEGRLR